MGQQQKSLCNPKSSRKIRTPSVGWPKNYPGLFRDLNTYNLNPESERNSIFTNQLYIELGRKSSPMLRTQFRTSIWFAVHFSVLSTENADIKSTYLVINESTITIQYCSLVPNKQLKTFILFQDFFQPLSSKYLGLPFSTEISLYNYLFLFGLLYAY